MARLKQRDTGSIVNVPDEDEEAVLATGYYERADKKASSAKAPAKKAASK
jgi:hypothetical protein